MSESMIAENEDPLMRGPAEEWGRLFFSGGFPGKEEAVISLLNRVTFCEDRIITTIAYSTRLGQLKVIKFIEKTYPEYFKKAMSADNPYIWDYLSDKKLKKDEACALYLVERKIHKPHG